MTHITIKGERVAVIVSESTLAMSQLPWAGSLPDDHLQAFAGELREAVVAGLPERVERVLIDWQAVAEVRAGESSS